ncbi:MAG: hypothetical protein J0L92_28720 [Deltaproteobacteria bacterium]|nr:hypothetical protein [Deltaproteobacteria bacterium]
METIHTATAAASTTEPFTCSKCSYVGAGQASSVEQASVNDGGMMFGNARAGEMARDEAEANAWQEAMSDVAMAPCPRCGAVDRSAWIGWLLKGRTLVKLGVGLFALSFGLMMLAAIGSAGNLLSVVCAAVMGLGLVPAGIALSVLPLVRKRSSTRRVRFTPSP